MRQNGQDLDSELEGEIHKIKRDAMNGLQSRLNRRVEGKINHAGEHDNKHDAEKEGERLHKEASDQELEEIARDICRTAEN